MEFCPQADKNINNIVGSRKYLITSRPIYRLAESTLLACA
jgi:hypothetical protein